MATILIVWKVKRVLYGPRAVNDLLFLLFSRVAEHLMLNRAGDTRSRPVSSQILGHVRNEHNPVFDAS